MRAALAILLSLLMALPAGAANKCVGPSATGSGTGADWNNIAAFSSFTPDRPSTNYVRDGSVGNRTFSTAISGALVVTLRAASEAEHGTAVGWVSSMGDGQVLSGKISFTTSNWKLDDGVAVAPTLFWATNNYKWVCSVSTATENFSASAVSNIVIQHIDIFGSGAIPQSPDNNDGFAAFGSELVTIRYCYFRNLGRCPFFLSDRNFIAEYNRIGTYDMTSDSTHSEVASIWDFSTGTVGDHTFRYNLITDNQSTGGIMWDNSSNTGAILAIYGNIWIKLSGGRAWVGEGPADNSNGLIGGWSGGNGEKFYNCLVYNNTFVNTPDGSYPYSEFPNTYSGNVAKNNLHYNVTESPAFSRFATHDYNHFINSGGTHSEANGTSIGTGYDPFNSYANLDFSLKSNTVAGVNLGAPYNVDLLGNTRTTWTRGAIEFNGAADTTPPNITNLASNTPSATGTTISWTTDDAATSKVDYGLDTSYGTSVSDATLVTSHSLNITGLSASTTYHFRVASTNAIPLGTNSADFTFTTAAADSTRPTVTITAPTDLSTVQDTVTYSATASDASGIASVEFYVAGVLLATDTTDAYSTSWNTRNNANGSTSLSAIATDSNGNKETNTISVTINNAALAGPIVHWRADEGTGTTATDSISGNIATAQNGATWTAGKRGSALSLDGVNDYFKAPNSTSINQTNALTVMAWVNISTNGDWQQLVAWPKAEGSFTDPYFGPAHLFLGNAGATGFYPQFQVTLTNSVRFSGESIVIAPYGQWVHLAGKYDLNEVVVYINGSPAGSHQVDIPGSPMLGFAQPLYIGAHGQPGEYAKGGVDDVRIYDRALTDTEIQAAMTEAATTTQMSGNMTIRAGAGITMR